MPFKIVQTIEAGETCLSVVPSGWEANGILRWPKKHLVGKLSQIETSAPDDKWEKMNCVRKREFKTRKEADDELDRMEAWPDTEVEDIPAPPPKKRVRQEPPSKIFAAKDFNNFVSSQLKSPEKMQAEVNTESNPVITAPAAVKVDDQQLLYVTENVDAEGTAEQGESSQIIFLTGGGQNLSHTANLDTIHENQRIIMENQSKIMQALAKIQTSQEYAMTHCQCRTTQPDMITTKPQVQHVLTPVGSVDELKALERALDDGKLMQQFSYGMTFICGITGKAQGTDCCYKLIDYFFTRPFLTQCSWTGMTRLADANSQQEPSTSGDAGAKIPLKYYKNIRALFLNLIMQADKDFSELDCEKFFKTVLKNSKQRLSAKILTSKHKNRPTNMKYNKSGTESGAAHTTSIDNSNRICNENTTESRDASDE